MYTLRPFGNQYSTRAYYRIAYNSSEKNAWAIYIGPNNAKRIKNLKIGYTSDFSTPIVYNDYLILSTNLREIPDIVEYDFTSFDGCEDMHVTVKFHVVNYGIYIGGTELTSRDMYKVPYAKSGKVYIDDAISGYLWANTPTLVMENATMSIKTPKSAIYNESNNSFTIKAIGECYIINGTPTPTLDMYIGTNTTITGGGTLNVVNTYEEARPALSTWDYGCLYLKGGTKLIADSYNGWGFWDDGSGFVDIESGSTFCAHSVNAATVSLPRAGHFTLGSGIDLRYPVGGSYSIDVYDASGTVVSKDWVVFGLAGATPPSESPADNLTGISPHPLTANAPQGSIYNLSGHRLNNMQKGINIINGKKILVK